MAQAAGQETGMAKNQKYVAYVGSYSYTGNAKGITIYDVDVEGGKFKKRSEIEVDNSSDIITSFDKKTLYTIADEGVVAYRILPNGDLEKLNSAKIRGIRARHLSIDKKNRFLFVSGYHDGKLTVMRLHKDGSVGEIADNIWHKGLGSIAARGSRPHITCSKPTPSGKFVISADPGIDQVSVYKFNQRTGELHLVDAVRVKLESSPCFLTFSKDGRFLYILSEQANSIDVYNYSYQEGDDHPEFNQIQSVCSTGKNKPGQLTAVACVRFTKNDDYVFCGNTGENTVTMFKRDAETGLLEPEFNLPISGAYPKDICLFPDEQHLVCANHESGTLTFFRIDYEKKLLLMCANELPVSEPNSCVIVPVEE